MDQSVRLREAILSESTKAEERAKQLEGTKNIERVAFLFRDPAFRAAPPNLTF